MVRVLVAVKGAEGEIFFRRAAELAALPAAESVALVHVIDAGARGDVEGSRERYLLRRPLPAERSTQLTRAEEDRAAASLHYAHQVLVECGVDEDRLHERVLRGKPNEAIRELAERESIDLVVVAGRGGKPGPHSVGKTARYLVDHVPHAALLVQAR